MIEKEATGTLFDDTTYVGPNVPVGLKASVLEGEPRIEIDGQHYVGKKAALHKLKQIPPGSVTRLLIGGGDARYVAKEFLKLADEAGVVLSLPKAMANP